jgi:hypothetical protein
LELSDTVPAPLKALVDHLQQLERFLEIELDDIGLWPANEEMIARLRFIADRGNSAYFREALVDAAANNDTGIDQFGEEQALATAPSEHYTTALARLRESGLSERGTGWSDQDLRHETWREVRRLHDEQIVAPLRASALATGDPLQRILLMACAEISEVFHMQSFAVAEQLSRGIAGRGAERGGQMPADQFQNLMATTDRLIAVAKAAKTCQPPPATSAAPQPIQLTSVPRLPHCG